MDEWVPAQDKVPEIHDFRASKTGPKGYKERTKRKLEEMEELHAQDQEQAAARMESDDAAMEEDAKQPSSKRGKGEDGAKFIPVSGRVWKAPAQRAGQVMKPQSKADWDKKMKLRASRQAFLDHKKLAVDSAKEKRKANAKQRREAEERKKANQKKSEVVQKISTETAKKMMKNKKQKKLLKTADTN